MKRTVILILMTLCAFTVFATKKDMTVKVAPVAIQISTSSEEPDYKVKSTYGIEREASYRKYFKENVFADMGLSLCRFDLPEGRPDMSTVMLFAGVGYDYQLSEKNKFTTHIDIAVDGLFYGGTESSTVTLKGGAELSFKINEKVDFAVGLDGTVGFAKKDGTKYRNYRILPALGMNIEL